MASRVLGAPVWRAVSAAAAPRAARRAVRVPRGPGLRPAPACGFSQQVPQREEEEGEGQGRMMPFEQYIERQRRLFWQQFGGGMLGAVAGMYTTSHAFVSRYPNLMDAPPDQIELIMGMDPMVAATASVMGGGVVSYFVGAELYRQVWRLFNSKLAGELDRREKDFGLRVMRHRAAGDSQADDFYGDSVKSVEGYRKWLRDQRSAKKFARQVAGNLTKTAQGADAPASAAADKPPAPAS